MSILHQSLYIRLHTMYACVLYVCISTYKYENICVSVCLFAFFSAISKPIGIPFGIKLLFTPGKVKNNTIKRNVLKSYCPFIYLSEGLKSDYRKTKLGRNLILFAKKLTGHREKFNGNK